MTYTKGPWRLAQAYQPETGRIEAHPMAPYIVDESGRNVAAAMIGAVSEAEYCANALLLSLAPDLVETLRAAHLALMGCKAETIAEPERRRIVGEIGELLRRVERES